MSDEKKPFWYLRTTIKDDCENFDNKDARGGKPTREALSEVETILEK